MTQERKSSFLRGAMLSVAVLALTATTAEATSNGADDQAPLVKINKNPYPSSYTPLPSVSTLITNVNIIDGNGGMIEGGAIGIRDGKIFFVGKEMPKIAFERTIDGAGRWVTPGIIDVHSHLGVYASPSVAAHSDGNEMTKPVTPEVWSEHSIWPQDPGFMRASAGGVTAMQVLPGSGNLIGGRGVTLKNVPGRVYQDMKFPGAPYGLKMACGENPKRFYGGQGKSPSTRMGNLANYRQAYANAQDYQQQWKKYERDHAAGKDVTPPKRDLELETLVGVLDGEILVNMHCYRADDMGSQLDMMKEFGYKIQTFHHAVEAYKIADRLAEEGVCAAMWADWWGFKMEAYDGIRENIPFVAKQKGSCAIVHSDSAVGIQRLNQETAKAVSDARKVGVNFTMAEAWTWLSRNPAKSLGILDRTGTLETGKNADVVLWSSNPFSVYAKADITFVDGAVIWDRHDPARQGVSDFELGQPGEGDMK